MTSPAMSPGSGSPQHGNHHQQQHQQQQQQQQQQPAARRDGAHYDPHSPSNSHSSLPPVFSKRARQIQQESGVNLAPPPTSNRSIPPLTPYRPPALRDSTDYHLPEFLRGSGSNSMDSPATLPTTRGRARAGTLPSSWSNQDQPNVSIGPRFGDRLGPDVRAARSGASSPLAEGHFAEGYDVEDSALNRFRSASNAVPSVGGYGRRLAPGPASPFTSSSPTSTTPTSTHQPEPLGNSFTSRLRSGSLASGLHSDAFGPNIFSAAWPDTSRALSNQQMRDALQMRNRGATIANPPGGGVGGGLGEMNLSGFASGLDGLDQDIRTLDYLGLEDPPNGEADIYGNRLLGRDRATTFAAATARPKLEDSGRTRSSSFAPNRGFGSSSIDEEIMVQSNPDAYQPLQSQQQHQQQQQQQPQMPFAQHGGLANASLQQRLGADLGGPGGSSSNSALGGRARAISVGMLDIPGGGAVPRPQPRTDLYAAQGQHASMAGSPVPPGMNEAISQDDLYAYALENGLDPAAFTAAAASAGVIVTPSSQQDPNRPANTRLRAGTVAALGGAGARMRTEQELMRLSASFGAGGQGSKSHTGQGLLGSDFDGLVAGAKSPTHASMYAGEPSFSASAAPPRERSSGSSGSSQQPSRSLWVGNLDNSTTGQELMQAFAPYGAIESLRLLPEKECGFVNFVETGDAIRAREDIMNRLGGRIRAQGTGPNGTVRIGFGKIDSATESSGNAASSRARPASPTAGLSSANAGDREEHLPTRALWIGSIPSSTTPSTLLSIFQPFGSIESARVLTHKNCGFINFERVDDAVRARKLLNGRDVLGTEVGAVRVGFAKVPSKSTDDGFPGDPTSEGYSSALESLEQLKGAGNVPAEHQSLSGNLENYRSHLVTDLLSSKQLQQQKSIDEPRQQQQQQATSAPTGAAPPLSLSHTLSASNSGLSASNSIVPSSDKGGVPLPTEMQPRVTTTDMQLLMEELSREEAPEEIEAHLHNVAKFRCLSTYCTSIPVVGEVGASRRFDTTKLREMRKAIEQGQYMQTELDQMATSYLDSIVDMSSDYIGNTLVQRFFERCSEPVKTALLERIAPHLAMIGIHKNGTWAAQKIIDMAQSPEQRALVAHHLRPYIPPLLLDQFGNYVVQCIIPYGKFREGGEDGRGSDFIFDAMVDRCWEIAQGRFGARSMRACLESSQVTKLQRKRVAIAIVLNSVPLATSPNGALLLTWLLDTSNLPGRYRLLAPRFTPHLTHLCTHKLASLTVLRVVSQNVEPDASRKILDALFDSPNDATLEEVLTDQVHGSQFVTKVLASQHIDPDRRQRYAEQVKRIVGQHRLTAVPAYRKLVEDLGMHFTASVPGAAGPPLARPAPTQSKGASSHGPANGQGDVSSMMMSMSLSGGDPASSLGGGPAGGLRQPIALTGHTSPPPAMAHSSSSGGVRAAGPPPRFPGNNRDSGGYSANTLSASSSGSGYDSQSRFRSQGQEGFNPWGNFSPPPNSAGSAANGHSGGLDFGSPTPPTRMNNARSPPNEGQMHTPGNYEVAGGHPSMGLAHSPTSLGPADYGNGLGMGASMSPPHHQYAPQMYLGEGGPGAYAQRPQPHPHTRHPAPFYPSAGGMQ